MTNTNFNEIKKLFRHIPRTVLKNVSFIELHNGTKIPFSRFKEKENWLTYYQVKDRMHSGSNIAVLARQNGLMFLDIDSDEDGNLKASEEFIEGIPKTFTVQTRSNGNHYYFLNENKYPNQLVYEKGVEIGELRTNWQYVVAPGSWVDPAQYTVLCDYPIAKLEGDILQYLKKGSIDDIQKPEIIHGKKGRAISDEHKAIIGNMGLGSDSRRKEIISWLEAKRGGLF